MSLMYFLCSKMKLLFSLLIVSSFLISLALGWLADPVSPWNKRLFEKTLSSSHTVTSCRTFSQQITSIYATTTVTDEDVTDESPKKRRRKKNKYANFSKVKQEIDPVEELLAESQRKQADLEQERQEKRRKRKPQVKVEPLTKIQFPDNKNIDPYDPTTFGYIEIGHVTGAHGVHGWLKVTCTTDFPVERLCTAGIRHLKPYNKRAPRQVTLVQGKHRLEDEYLIQLLDVEDRDAAAKLRGATLYVREEQKYAQASSDVPSTESPNQPQEYLVSDLVNMEVIDQQTKNLVGKVAGVVLGEDMCSIPGLGQDLLEVTLQRGPMASWRDELVLIPFVPQIVPMVDTTARQIFIDPPLGLLDLTYFREERVRLKGFLPPSWDGDEDKGMPDEA